MWFKHDTSKDIDHTQQYGDCLNRIVKLSAELELLKAHMEAHKLQLDNLRGNFSRKLKGMKEEEEKAGQKEEEVKTETIIKEDLVGFG
jgi:predicted  nucleic acid-binding Zn-ribbon protein